MAISGHKLRAAIGCVAFFATGVAQAQVLGLPPLEGRPTAKAVEAGRRLFSDTRLSADGHVSCATCHQPSRAFTDGRATSLGVAGKIGTRNTPSLVNILFARPLFWDGRGEALAVHVLDPLYNPVEHGLSGAGELKRLAAADSADVGNALAAFLRAQVAGDSPFDRYYFGKRKNAMSASAVRGLDLFRGRAGCAACHTIDKGSALFTDQQFHSLGIGMEKVERKLPALAARVRAADPAKLGHLVLGDAEIATLGRFVATGKPADIGKFRTPSLRNVALTAPYMHDGSMATLEAAIELEANYRLLASGRPVTLSVEDKADLVEFLKALTSPDATRVR
jgi:cytochrome c peroxidase